MLTQAYLWQLSFTEKTKPSRCVFRGVYRAPPGVLLLGDWTAQCHVEYIQITRLVWLWPT